MFVNPFGVSLGNLFLLPHFPSNALEDMIRGSGVTEVNYTVGGSGG